MHKVLIAEDNQFLRKALSTGLQRYRDQFEVLTAANGQEAIDVLDYMPISILVTDLKMPEVDGFALLEHMNANHPEVPCIVMTAHGSPQIKKRLDSDVLRYIEKPIKTEQLATIISEALAHDNPHGSLNGISTANFLQMIEMEEKTCLFEVESHQHKKGYFYFEKGVIYDAAYGETRGLEAALRVLAMEKVKIRFKTIPRDDGRKVRRIHMTAAGLIMEAAVRRDEAIISESERKVLEAERLASARAMAAEPFDDGTPFPLPLEEQVQAPTQVEILAQCLKEQDLLEALHALLETLQKIDGYLASSVVEFSGFLLMSDTCDPDIPIEHSGMVFQGAYRSFQRVCSHNGFGETKETVINTDKNAIYIQAAYQDHEHGVNIIVFLREGGNIGALKLKMKQHINPLLNALKASEKRVRERETETV